MKQMLWMLLVVAAPAFGASRFVDSASLYECGGRVELRESSDNLHLQFENVRYCENLVVRTTWGKVLGRYSLAQGRRSPYSANFTLSQSMWRELGRGKLVLEVYGRSDEDTVFLRVNEYGGHTPGRDPRQCGGHNDGRFTGWGLTNSCRCAYYVRGKFQRHAEPWEEYKCR